MPKSKVLYRTRVEEHLRLASAALLASGRSGITIKQISDEIGVPYQTLRWYMKAEIANPNYAVVDQIRRYLNQFHEMSSANYIYRVGEAEEQGQALPGRAATAPAQASVA